MSMRSFRRGGCLPLLAFPLMALGCASDGPGLPTTPPTTITKVASGGFTAPTDAVASPDGETFYFAALDPAGDAAIFSVASHAGSVAHALASGAPLAHPSGLVLSCDGRTLYIADGGDGAHAALYALPTAGGSALALSADGIGEADGLAMGPDCETLHVTGKTPEAVPAVFQLPRTGGLVHVLFAGAPLVSPTGVHVDGNGVAWVMDHLAPGSDSGALFAVSASGDTATPVATSLRMGTPGGVSLVAGGGTAVIPTRDADGHGQLTAIVIATGLVTQIPALALSEPAGIRTARAAGVFALVDAKGDAIYRAE